MNVFLGISSLLVFPGGLFLVVSGLLYEWADHKLLALLQNRVGPRWFQPLADAVVAELLEANGFVTDKAEARRLAAQLQKVES